MLVDRITSLGLFEVHYVARAVPQDTVRAPYELHRITDTKHRAGVFFPDAPRLWRLLRRIQPDVIYQRVGRSYTGVAAYYARRYARRLVWHVASDVDVIPFAPTGRWNDPLLRIEKKILEFGVRNADAIIVQSKRQGALLMQNYGRTYTAHIPNFQPLPTSQVVKSSDCFTVCWIANIKALKQPELFLRLAQDFLDRPRVKFEMVGSMGSASDRTWDALRADVRRLPNLRCWGQQPQSAVNELLSRAHVLVNTSTHEGFSNAFIQAWLRQVPVVSLNSDPDDLLSVRELGFCAQGNYEAMRSAIERLEADPALRASVGVRAAEYASNNFSEANIDRVIELLSGCPDSAATIVSGGKAQSHKTI